MSPSRPPLTYFIAARWPGSVKIGRSVDPKRRLRQLQTGCPERLFLLATCENVEGVLHDVFRGRRKIGEWFDPDEELMDWIESLYGFQRPS